jgi:hypothetical protein
MPDPHYPAHTPLEPQKIDSVLPAFSNSARSLFLLYASSAVAGRFILVYPSLIKSPWQHRHLSSTTCAGARTDGGNILLVTPPLIRFPRLRRRRQQVSAATRSSCRRRGGRPPQGGRYLSGCPRTADCDLCRGTRLIPNPFSFNAAALRGNGVLKRQRNPVIITLWRKSIWLAVVH